jgi:hypothetical protein
VDRLTLISRLAGIIALASAGAKDEDLTLAVQQLAVERGAAQRLQHHQPTLPDVSTAAPGVQQEAPLNARIQLVYDYWKSRTGHVSARLLPERARHIRARLKDFTTVDLCDAIDGCVASDFHTGTNDRGERYDWIENIMHNGVTVEKHIARARRAGTGALRDLNPETAKLRAELDRAMEVGDVTGANELNRRLAASLRGVAKSGG